MAKRRASRSPSSRSGAQKSAFPAFEVDENSMEFGLEGPTAHDSGQPTGRMIVTAMGDGKRAMDSALKAVAKSTGLSASSSNVMMSSDAGDGAAAVSETMTADFVVFEALNIAVVNGTPDTAGMMMAASAGDDGMIVEPEYWNEALGFDVDEQAGSTPDVLDDDPGMPVPGIAGSGVSRDFLLGARSVIDMMLQGTAAAADMPGTAALTRCFRDTNQLTWGLQATRSSTTGLTGRGVRVAVLDSGFDGAHPDFVGRSVARATFIPSSQPDNGPDDNNSHGTHCIGTACGSRTPASGRRYGVATDAEIFSGKVLRVGSNGRASGADAWILAGIDWALRNRCDVISMSLGSPVNSAQFPQMYEMAAQRALRQGSLIIAAAGNDSRRPGQIAAVGRPANCPSIVAVAAVDSCFGIASFSNGQQFGSGGEINVSGPGVRVHSSIPPSTSPTGRTTGLKNGTSMACPHAAGIAALIHQQTGLTGVPLYREMRRRALNIGIRRDFGNGMVRV